MSEVLKARIDEESKESLEESKDQNDSLAVSDNALNSQPPGNVLGTSISQSSFKNYSFHAEQRNAKNMIK